jgi:hypothetical protein
MNESEKARDRREELRGIFTLGLLAVLVAIKFQNKTLMVIVGKTRVDIIPLINVTIVFWSLFAFFMVLALSRYVIGKTLAGVFQTISKAFLLIYFVLLAIFGTAYFTLGFPTRSFWVLLFLGFCIVYTLLLSLIIKLKSPKDVRKKITKLNLLLLTLLIIFFGSFMELMYFPDERFLIVFFVLGFGSFIALSLVAEKITKKTKVSQNEKLQQDEKEKC